MRKAFDANVAKLKPRLKPGAAVADAGEPVAPAPTATPASTATPTAAATPTATPAATPEPAPSAGADARTARAQIEERLALQEESPAPGADVHSRRERLEKIKRKVAEAARPHPRADPVPADPARAAESVLGLVHDLDVELVRAREREDALRADLEEVRKELGRAATEGRTAVERLAATEKELEEKRAVLGDLLGEMQALEQERDEALRRAQALAALDEERAKLLEDLGRRADEEARLRAEREAEVERLSEELRLAGTEGARLRAAVGELARERDQLGADLDRSRRERDELAEAKKALEAVHAALSQARARLV
jgi:chromosome segregation ATPase